MTPSPEFLLSEAHLALSKARKLKSEKTKDLGSPIELPGKPLDILLQGNHAWIAENTHVARKIDLESGKTIQIFKGHTGPVTSLAIVASDSASQDLLVTGSWDKTIKIWNTETMNAVSTTEAHGDFVKTLLVLPSLGILISGGSDKIVRLWNLSKCLEGHPLESVGSISAHTRPVENLAAKMDSEVRFVLYTADTMGVIKVWNVHQSEGDKSWRSDLVTQLNHHRTRINELIVGEGQLWSASSDETVQIVAEPNSSASAKEPLAVITHPTAVRCILPLSLSDLGEPYLITGSGDEIRVYDLATLEEPELLCVLDGHWHDIISLKLWTRKSVQDDRTLIEPWIVTASLDGTVRKWKLTDLLNMKQQPAPVKESIVEASSKPLENQSGLTEEEERELAELMD